MSFRRCFMNPGIRDLPIDERIQLVEDVWDSIAEDQQKLELTQAQREELDRRLLAYEKDGDAGNDAGTVLEEIRRRL
jgi:putative addiction module component (TIGR02574 family)